MFEAFAGFYLVLLAMSSLGYLVALVENEEPASRNKQVARLSVSPIEQRSFKKHLYIHLVLLLLDLAFQLNTVAIFLWGQHLGSAFLFTFLLARPGHQKRISSDLRQVPLSHALL